MQMNDGTMNPVEEFEANKDPLPKQYPELVFAVGEIVQVKGGSFRIKSIGKKMMVLEGLPGTRIKTK